MPYKIEETDGLLEVNLSGDVSKWDVLKIIFTLHQKAPRKEKSDLWLIAEDAMVPYSTFSTIIHATRKLVSPDMLGSRTALVAEDEFQRAQADLYCREAKGLPFEMRAFESKDAAVQWLRAS